MLLSSLSFYLLFSFRRLQVRLMQIDSWLSLYVPGCSCIGVKFIFSGLPGLAYLYTFFDLSVLFVYYRVSFPRNTSPIIHKECF